MENQITILKGAERVRRRPAVIFGSDDIQGVFNGFEGLLDLLAKEGFDGYCDRITVTQYLDDSIEIQDNGRGLFLGAPDCDDDTIWKDIFCQLYGGSLYEENATSRNLFEAPKEGIEEFTETLDLCAMQYASAYMDVTVVRDGYKQSLHFEKGEIVGTRKKEPCADPSCTCIRFQPDREVFTQISVPAKEIMDKLRTIAIQIPGMAATFCQETKEEGLIKTQFYYPGGIGDYLQTQSAPVYTQELTAEGQERYNKPRYTATVKIGIGFAENAGFVQCYHNLRVLTLGGTHCQKALKEIKQYLQWMLEVDIQEETLLKHLQLVIVTKAKYSHWVTGQRTGITNTLIRDLTQDSIGGDFQYFVKQNKEYLSTLFGK